MKHSIWPACALICRLAAVPAAAAQGADVKPNSQPTAEEVKIQLDAAARAHLERVERTLRPNQANKEVSNQGKGFVAKYLEVDKDRLSTELADHQVQGFAYVGNLIYVVHEYQCQGATRQEALNGSCQKVKSSRIREFTRYANGKWHL